MRACCLIIKVYAYVSRCEACPVHICPKQVVMLKVTTKLNTRAQQQILLGLRVLNLQHNCHINAILQKFC